MSTPTSSLVAPHTVVPVGASETVPTSLAPSAVYVDNELTPPAPDVSECFHKENYTVRQWAGHINYTVAAYTYVTGGSLTDPKFTEHGGEVWVILVHGGGCQAQAFKQFANIDIKASIDGLAEQQLPPTGSGERQYDPSGQITPFTKYTIDYGHLMTLLRNGGADFVSFQAKYGDVYSTFIGTQNGEVMVNGKEVEFLVTGSGSPDGPNMNIHGFSVFSTFTRIEGISINIEYNVIVNGSNSDLTWRDNGSKSFTLNLMPEH